MVLPSCTTQYTGSTNKATTGAMNALSDQIDAVYLVKCEDPLGLSDDHIDNYVEVKRENAVRWKHCRLRMSCLVDRIKGITDKKCIEEITND